MPTGFITPASAASSIGLTTGRIYQLLREGKLPYDKCLGRLRIRVEDWEAFLASQSSVSHESVK